MSEQGNTEVICIRTGMMLNNSWLVKNNDNNEGFLVDASFSGNIIARQIKETGISLKGILLTHCHYDHIYSVDILRNEFSEDGVRVYAGSDEKELLLDPKYNLIQKHRLPLDPVKADEYLEDGEITEIAGINVKTIFTPGHTAGGVCYYIESEKLLFSGDTLFEGSFGRTDLPTGDTNTLVRSIKEKLFKLPGDTKVLPGHGEITDIKYESGTNPILQYD